MTQQSAKAEPKAHPKLAGGFKPPRSAFESTISPDPNSEFPAEPGRYALYIHLGCPFAHRTNLVYHLKHLQPIVQLIIVSIHRDGDSGWGFDGTSGSDPIDPLYGFKNFLQLYEKAKPDYKGRYSVPVLWDKKKETIVNNNSGDIARMLSSAFDAFLPEQLRDVNKPGGGLLPEDLKEHIDELNDRINDEINWGTYKCGLIAQTQEDYDAAMKSLFGRFDAFEEALGKYRYLLGDHITEPDIWLYTTTVRFDIAYYAMFRCNYKRVREDYPNIHRWVRELYWEVHDEIKGAFKSTTHTDIFMEGYAHAALGHQIVPWGPKVPVLPLDT